MRIAIDIRSLLHAHRTGVGEYTSEFISSLLSQRDDHEYYLFYNAYYDMSSVVPSWSDPRVHVVVTRWPNKLFHLLLKFRLIALDRIIEKKTGVTMDCFFSPNIHFTYIARVPHILTIHDLSFELYKECYSLGRRLWHYIVNPRLQVQRARCILTPSAHTKQDVLDHYGIDSSRVHVIYPGISSSWSTPSTETIGQVKQRYRLPDRYILFLGTIEPRKNIPTLVEAFEKSGLVSHGYTLIIAGARGWKEQDIFARIKNTNGVHYIGYVEAIEKPALFAGAQVFVYPSLYEGFGFPVVEALSVGTPVITSNRSSLPEICADRCVLIDPDSCDDIALQLRFCCEQGRVEKNSAIEVTAWNASARQFLSLCEQIRSI